MEKIGEECVIINWISNEIAKKPKRELNIAKYFPKKCPYRLTEREGILGGSASVIFLKNKKTDDPFVLKAPKERKDCYQNDIANEARILGRLSHENIIVRTGEIFIDSVQCIILPDAGMDLSSFLLNEGPQPLSVIKNIATQVFSALAYLESKRIAHADIKPENLLLKEGKITLIDFAFSFNGCKKTGFFGTPEYTAPEMLLGREVSSAIDMWGCACVLFALYTKSLLFPGQGTFFPGMIRVHEATLERTYPHRWHNLPLYRRAQRKTIELSSLRQLLVLYQDREATAESRERFSSLLNQMLIFEPEDRLRAAHAYEEIAQRESF